MLKTAQIKSKYGTPCDNKQFVTIDLPFPLKLAWDVSTSVKKLTCHKLISDRLLNVFKEIKKAYTEEEIETLNINLLGGCFNCRSMRGGKDWSRHAWAIAIDLSPEKNGLKTPWKDSQFANPEYDKFMDIFYKNGFVNQGKELGFDAMHFETAY